LCKAVLKIDLELFLAQGARGGLDRGGGGGECWSDRVMENWSTGVLGCWGAGVLVWIVF
jgi:hypothetical protein